ncbi:septin and tuftelin-interacting protein 1 homolog 1-like [Bidens hawaiensis]|uniref:septin and tuftelin-interacting protein 1 homolog 1-like n=1 Tax=Bidens hawaiensis TaxID=980011 RepID=UPI00404979A4
MGYQRGAGVGINAQGIVDPIQPKIRPRRQMGIGFNGFREQLSPPPPVLVPPYIPPVRRLPPKRDPNLSKILFKTNLVADIAEHGFQKKTDELKTEPQTVTALQEQLQQLGADADRQQKQIENMEQIIKVIEHLDHASRTGTLTLDSLARFFTDLQKQFPDEYSLCDLSIIACSFHVIDSTWHARDPEPLLQFLDSWDGKLPRQMMNTLLDRVVMPKLLAAVESWDPSIERIAIHTWVHPWLPFFGERLDLLYPRIRAKLEAALPAWRPSDISAYAILSPWRTLFDPVIWDQLMTGFIVPKLRVVMNEFQVNPADQKLDLFHQVLTWVNMIPFPHMIDLMDLFFDKWESVLYRWLCSEPVLEEVYRWFENWIECLPADLLLNDHIQARLHAGFVMIQQASKGLEVVQPSREDISVLKDESHERRAAVVEEEELSFKEVLEFHARENDLLFKPKHGRMLDGHQIYGFGKVNVVVDCLNERVRAQIEDKWSLVSLKRLVELNTGVVR